MSNRPDKRSNVFISKKMSRCLRHDPGKYGLTLDEYGFVDLDEFLAAMNRVHHFDPPLSEEKIREIIRTGSKRRFEIRNGKICALYGHSLPGIVTRKEAEPPDVLYHGTARRFLPSIMEKGLLPMGRQYVHLSADIETALEVGRRRDREPAVLSVDTEAAREAGVIFYIGNEKVWLSGEIPPEYLRRIR